MNPLMTEQLADGIYFHSLTDQRFKTNRISIHLFVPLTTQTASEYAVLPALLRKRTRKYPDMLALNHKLQSLYGAYLGGDVRKIGDNQVLTLAVSCPDDRFALAGEGLTEQATELLLQMLLDPFLENNLFVEQDLALEKQSLLELLASEQNDKRLFALTRTTEILCDGEGFGCNKYGSAESIEKLTPEQVTKAYRTLLERAQMHILFLGSGNSSCVKEMLKKDLSPLSRIAPSSIATKPLMPHSELQRDTDLFPVSQAKLVLGFSVVAQTERERAAAQLMSFLYGGTPISNLFLNVREKLSLCYYCAARYDQVKGVLLVDSGVEQQNVQKAEKEILKQLDEIRQGNFEEDRFQNTILSMRNGFTTIGDSTGALESWYLTRIASGNLYSPEEAMKTLSEITKEEVMAAACTVQLDTVYLLKGDNG